MDYIIVGSNIEIFLKQFTDGAKREILQNAINTMFNKEVTLTVRLPKASDVTVSPRLSSTQAAPTQTPPQTQKKQEVPTPQAKPDNNKTTVNNEYNNDNDLDDIQKDTTLSSYDAHSEEYYMHSDTVNMVLDVFGGKIID